MTVTTWSLFGSARQSRTFLWRRITRIYPPYWIALLPILVVYALWPGMVDSHAATWPDLLASFLLLPQNGEPLLLVSWTLVFEMAFYLVFAVALSFSRRWLPFVLAAWTLGIIFAAIHWGGSANPYLKFFGNPLPIEFFFGIGAGALIMQGVLKRPAIARAVGIVLVGTMMTLDSISGIDTTLWARAIVAGSGCGLILYGSVVLEKDRGIIFPRWLDALGDASYAMLLLVAFGLVIAVSLGLFRFAERPLARALHRYTTAPLGRRIARLRC